MALSKELLKECEAMPGLIDELVGKKYNEYASFYIPVQHHYEKLQTAVKELWEKYENHEPDKPKGLHVVKDKPPIPLDVLPEEISSDFAMEWVRSFMLFAETAHKAFEQKKKNFL